MSVAIIKMPRRELSAALSRLNNTAPRKSHKAILQCARLTVDGERVELAATDCERVHTERVEPFDVAGDGAAVRLLVNVAELSKAAAALKQREITLTVDSENGRTTVDGLQLSNAPNVDEFPALSHCFDDEQFATLGGAIVNAAELSRLLSLATFATDADSSRYALGGCLFECAAGSLGGLQIVGTDGRRLSAVATANPPSFAGDIVDGVVPSSTCELILRQLAKTGAAKTVVVELLKRKPKPAPPATPPNSATGEPVAAEPADVEPPAKWDSPNRGDFVRVACFDVDGNALSIVTTRTIDGRFPNWRQVTASGNRRGTIRVDELATLCKRVSLLTTHESRGVDFGFRPSRLFVRYRALSGGRFRAAVELGNAGEYAAGRLRLDASFVAELMKAAAAAGLATVDIFAGSANEPVKFELGGAGYHIIMPMARERSRPQRVAKSTATPPSSASDEAGNAEPVAA